MADTREPSPRSQQVYKGGKKEKDKKDKTKTKGQQLEESGQYLKDPETEDLSKGTLLIKRDSTVQQGINRDKTKNKDFDQILNPDGSYRRPSLGQLREGVDWKKRANQLLMIGAGGAAIVGQGLKSLLINPYGGI